MRAYRTAAGALVATQEEAREAGRGWQREDIPDADKASLLAFINAERERKAERTERLPAPPLQRAAPAPAEPVPPAMRQGGAIAILSRIDDGPEVDRLCEVIGAASGYALARFASCVAVRFQRLSQPKGE